MCAVCSLKVFLYFGYGNAFGLFFAEDGDERRCFETAGTRGDTEETGLRVPRYFAFAAGFDAQSHHAKHNEQFEFVGDSILDYTVARMLFDAFPKLTEGELSRLRASQVNECVLVEMSAEMNVGDSLYLGAGVLKSGGCRRHLIVADAMEAIFAAVSSMLI